MERQAKDGTFYRKIDADEWEPVTRTAKDGTVFKKVGSDEWAPLKSEKTSEPKSHFGIPETTIEGTLRALPAAGAIGGGALGTVAGPIGAVLAAGGGAFAGEALANTIRAGLGMESAPKSREEIWVRPIEEGLKGATGEGAGQIISPALSVAKGVALSAGKSAKNAVFGKPSVMPEVVETTESSLKFKNLGFDPKPKPNAEEIKSATKTFGAQATPGMISSNPNVQNLENIIGQSPTVAGEKVRKSYDPIMKGVKKAADDLAPTGSLTPYEAGTEAKKGILAKIGEKSEPLAASFEQIRESAKNIKVNPHASHRAANRLMKQDLAEFSELPQGQAIKKYSDLIRNAKSIDSLKQLRSSVDNEIGSAIDAGQGQLAMALGKVKSSIQRLERREILRAAIENSATKSQGEAAAKDLIRQIKQTNKGWRAMMSELEIIAKAGGIRKIGSPKHLAKIIDEMPSEKLADRFFNTKNYDALTDIKTHLPEEFEVLKQYKLSQIAEKSMTKGEIDPHKLVRNLSSLGKEARILIFGESGERVLADMKTVLNNMPSKVGASDTPRGMMWANFLSPSGWSQEAQSAYSYMLLQGKKVPTPGRVLEWSAKKSLSPSVTRPAGYIGVGVFSNELENSTKHEGKQ